MSKSISKIIYDIIIEMQLNLLRVDAGMRSDVIRKLTGLEDILVTRIMVNDVESPNNRNYNTKRFDKLIYESNNAINDTFLEISNDQELLLKELAALQAQILANQVNDNIGNIIFSQSKLTKTQINAIYSNTLIEGSPSKDWWSRQATAIRNRFIDSVRTGVLLGEENDKIVSRVRGTKAQNYKDGIIAIAKKDAEILIRSSVQSIANEARFQLMEKNNDIITSYQHISTLDNRTTTQCIVRDGLRWSSKNKNPIGHSVPFQVPPIHFGCRSTLIPIIDNSRLPSTAKRTSDEGELPISTTFKGFLEGKSKSYQDELLGVGRAKLWRDGKITLRDLLDQRGNPLTLRDLRNKFNINN